MQEKKPYIAVAVNTFEAMRHCIEEQVKLFSIENPLYSALKGQRWSRSCVPDYEVTEYENKQVMLLKKVRGEAVFDDESYVPFYLPLHWENWKS